MGKATWTVIDEADPSSSKESALKYIKRYIKSVTTPDVSLQDFQEALNVS